MLKAAVAISCFMLIIIIVNAQNLQAGGLIVDVKPHEAVITISEEADLAIIDLRTPAEFAEGHLEGAININAIAPNFERQLRNEDLLEDRNWLVYCRTGARSRNVLPALQRVAKGTVYHLKDGIVAWSKAGYPVVK